MAKKSIQEMGTRERRRHSLAVRSLHTTVLQIVTVSLVALTVGLGLYSFFTINRYISDASSISRSAASMLERYVGVDALADEVMTAYFDQDDGEREQVWTEAYRARFEPFVQRADFEQINWTLSQFGEAFDLSSIYVAGFDVENSAMVYIIDAGAPEDTLKPGDWEEVSPNGIQAFLNWDGSKPVYRIANTESYGFLCTSGAPIHNGEGSIAAFVFVDVYMADFVKGIQWFAIGYGVILAAATALIGLLSARRVHDRLVQPITTIADAAQDYVRDRQSGAMVTDRFKSLDIHTGDEIENLGSTMSYMEQSVNEYLENLTRVTAEKERIGAELNVAKQIQADMLPRIFPPFPERHDFDIDATMDPAKEVGGDFYDLFLIDEDHLCLVMADVSGKGVPAALFMVIAKTLIKNHALHGESPSEILYNVNNQLCEGNEAEMFVTVWLAIIELSTGKGVAANAGHEHPALCRNDGSYELVVYRHAPAVAAMEGIRFREHGFELYPGDRLFVYTDGVPEATDAHNELFGSERLVAALNRDPDADPKTLLCTVREEIDAFVGDAPQFDDLTMLALYYNGGQSDA